ncbi:hypothetical protein DYB32_002505 [Aphanomyces invadans]|uniref:E2F/DP family winged-helix DNA-binding domain-containing protein n=1 Tax=Aphanomyces invadans TaxID=157072 RepID=A0A418B388_9STRA|nr:hypothetical protein DYB32_002505 [Aphanomyces invadans]
MTSLSASAVLTGNVDEHQTPSNTKIPALWQVTHKLLRCIFARGNSISLREIYTLDDDKDGSSSKSRRYYDVLAVLTTCNILQLNTTSKFDRAKYAKLNPLILTDPQSFSVFDQVRRHDNSMSVAPVFIQRQSKLKVISRDKRPRLWAKQKATGSQQQMIAHAESNTPCEDYPSAGNTISFATLLEKSLFDIEPFEPFCHAAATDASDDHSISIANKTDFKLLLSPCKGMYESDEFESFFSQFPLTDCDSLEVDDVGDMEL